MEIPKEFQEVAMEFVNKRHSESKNFFVQKNGYTIKCVEKFKEGSGSSPKEMVRVKTIDELIEVSRKNALDKSNDLIYFAIMVVYLSMELAFKGVEYPESLLKSDMVAIKHCREIGLPVKNIVNDVVEKLKDTPIKLNEKRVKQLVESVN